MFKFNLGRQRHFIRTRYESLVSLLSWRYAASLPNRESAAARQEFRQLLQQHSQDVSFYRTCADLQATYRFNFTPKLDHAAVEARSNTSVEAEENQLLDGLVHLLRHARFHPLSVSEERFATKESYRFSSSVAVKWHAYDNTLLSKKLGAIYPTKSMPASANRVWFFHRGVGLERRRGFFISEKINELLRRGIARLLDQTARSRRRLEATNDRLMVFLYARIADVFQIVRSTANRWRGKAKMAPLTNVAVPELSARMDSTPKAGTSGLSDSQKEEVQKVFDHALEKALCERQTLADYALSAWNLLTRVTLQEPSYEHVVVVYRKVDLELSSITPGEYAEEPNYKQLLPKGNPLNINIKVFRDVPMSDVELLLPDKRVFLAYSDIVQLGVMSTILVATSSDVLFIANSKAWLLAVIASASYSLRVLSRMYASWAYYTTLTDTVLGDQILAHGPPALGWIGVLAEEQLKKEMAILLLSIIELQHERKSAEYSIDDIMDKCRLVVQATCGDTVIFEPKEALDMLVKKQAISRRIDDTGVEWYRFKHE